MSTLKEAWSGSIKGGRALTLADSAIPQSEAERSRIFRELEGIREQNRQRAIERARRRAERGE